MFKLDLSPTYKYPVNLELVDADGRPVKRSFEASFARLDQTEIDELLDGARAGEVKDLQICERVLVGWSGIQDGDGNAIEFSPEARARLLNVHPVRPSVVVAWMESLNGAKRKNS